MVRLGGGGRGVSEVQDRLGLHSEFLAHLSYLSLKERNKQRRCLVMRWLSLAPKLDDPCSVPGVHMVKEK